MLVDNGLISVIMPTYNAEKYIKKAIESIINQTYCNWELIVIDDASTDSTQYIVNEYSHVDNRIKLIEGKKQGVGGALNLGIKAANGNYIARMDADDISLPLRFEKQIDFMEKYRDIEVCATQYQILRYNEIQPQNIGVLFTDQDIKAGMIFNNVLCHPTIMFRKKIFDDGWNYKENIIAEDFDLWTRMIPEIKFGCIKEVLLYYRCENQNISYQIALDRKNKSDSQIIKACITRLFRMDLHNYCDDIFCVNGRYYQINNICEYLIKQLELLSQIYIQNKKFKVISVDALRKSFYTRWQVLLTFIKIPDDVLMINDALFIKNIDEIFDDNKRLNDYKNKLEEIQAYYRKRIKIFKKIIIYGAGKKGKELLEKYLILKEQKMIDCELEAIIDKNVKDITIASNQYIVSSPQILNQLKADIILISTPKYYEEIRIELMEMGISPECIFSGSILWFV